MHLTVPKQVYGDLFSNGINNSLVHGVVPRSAKFADFSLAVARFFAHLTTFAFMIHKKCNKCQTFFAKIAKMFTINHILHEFRFFVTVFLRKIVKTVKFTRKVDKNFKTGVILAHFDFFVKKSLMIQLSEYL